MKKTIKKLAPKVLSKVKPVDSRLRKIPAYAKLSSFLHVRYHQFLGGSSPQIRFYSKNYDEKIYTKKQILLDSFWGRKIGCNTYAIYQELINDDFFSEYEFIWVKNKDVSAPDALLNNVRVKFVEYNSEKFILALLESEIIITNMTLSSWFSPKTGQKIYTPWHGIPLKMLGRDSDHRLSVTANTQRTFNLSAGVFSAGPYSTEHIYKRGYRSSLVLDRVREVGSPRVDLMLRADTSDLKNKLGVDPKKRILLYAPTWRGNPDRISLEVDDQVNAVLSLQERFSQEYEIFVSLHHLTKNKVGTLDVPVKYVPDQVDITEFLSVTDVLISDYSSIIFDYLVLNRPIILHVPDLNDYISDRGLYCNINEIPAAISKTTDELIESVKGCRLPSSFDIYHQAVNKFIPNEDGKASKRAVEVMKNDFINNPFTLPKNKKNILIYAGAFKLNGITTSILSLTNNIDYSKWDVSVIVNGTTIDKDNARYEIFRKLNKNVNVIVKVGATITSPVERIAYYKFLSNRDLDDNANTSVESVIRREFRRILGENKFDVAIDFDGYSGYWSTFIGTSPSATKVIYQHNDLFAEAYNSDVNRQNPGLKSVFRRYKYFDRIVSVSKQVKSVNFDNLNKYYPSTAVVTHVSNSISVNNIRDLSQVPLALTLKQGLDIIKDSNVIKFINIARLSPEKNQARLIRAFSKVVEQGYETVLFIVGYGPNEKKLKSLAARYFVSDRVIFTGRLTNPYPLLRECDCHVLSSDYEGQGIVLLEAMTLGIPCISTDMPAVHSIIGDGVGVICDMNDVALAEAMIAFCDAKSGAPNFDPDVYAQKSLNEFYENVCGE